LTSANTASDIEVADGVGQEVKSIIGSEFESDIEIVCFVPV
jgi:hypothetical protein